MNSRRTLAFFAFIVTGIFALPVSGQWQHHPAGSAFALSFAADSGEQKMWLGVARGGLWQSDDGGNTWEAVNYRLVSGANLVPFDIHVGDATGHSVFARASNRATLTQSWYSRDGGLTWMHLPENLVSGNGGDFLQNWQHDHDVWFHLEMEHFNRSLDSGLTWESFRIDRDGAGQQKTGLYEDPLRDSTLYCTGYYQYASSTGRSYGGLCQSDNLGQTWRPILDFHSLYGVDDAFVDGMARLSNNDLIALGSPSNPLWENGTVLVSTDNGISWLRIQNGLPDRFWPSQIVEDALEPGTLFLGGEQKYGLYWSHDYGRTWSRCLNDLPNNVTFVNHIYRNPFSGTIYVSMTGWGVYKTTDHGQSWQPIPMPLIGPLGNLGVTDESVFVRDDAYRQWRLDQIGDEWQEMSVPDSPDTLVLMRPICYHSGDTLVSALWKRNILGPATDVLQMIYSNDNGMTWLSDPFLPFLTEQYFITQRWQYGTRFVTSRSDALFLSDDLGHSWDSLAVPDFGTVRSIALNDSTINVMTGYTPLNVYRTTNRGVTWQDLNLNAPMEWDADPQLFVMGNEVFVTVQGHCRRYIGEQWEERGAIPNYENLDFMVVVQRDPITLFGLSYLDNQAWVSEDSGWTWRQPELIPPYGDQGFSFTAMRYDEQQHRIWAIHALGACYLDDTELSSDGTLTFHPAQFTVLSAYPNPFNSSTRILFDLQKTAPVELAIYDLEGRLVQTLTEGMIPAGRHENLFDGSTFASGTYFVHLKTDNMTRTQKLLLIR